MDEHMHHDDLIENVAQEYSDILENSEQGVYIYLDDTHKVCNEKFSMLLGYDSPEEWASVETSFPDAFVANKSQETLVNAFQNAMENMTGSMNKIVWKKKDGTTVDSEVILTPISYEGHLFALHFVSAA